MPRTPPLLLPTTACSSYFNKQETKETNAFESDMDDKTNGQEPMEDELAQLLASSADSVDQEEEQDQEGSPISDSYSNDESLDQTKKKPNEKFPFLDML
ncbi:hypothetical protein DFQ28_010615 [Apophysomyces sp. BC1034]|nr:hypothetical protein DFQ29_008164 [Apophysomyces sp. BC1021]KAG0191924.1 hypothetical protein DFQ28_010615 [Apophysomyces sp. BC1034]